jgi:hypothetical protein
MSGWETPQIAALPKIIVNYSDAGDIDRIIQFDTIKRVLFAQYRSSLADEFAHAAGYPDTLSAAICHLFLHRLDDR